MFKTIKNAINNTIDATIINAFTILSRYFVTLDPVLNSYYEMAAPITFAGDFEIEVEFSTTEKSAEVHILDSTADILLKLVVNPTTNTPRFFIGNGSSWIVVLEGTTDVTDGKLHIITADKTGDNYRIFVDGILEASGTNSGSVTPSLAYIGRRSNGTSYNQIIANAKFTDKSGASDVITTFKLDNSPAAANYVYSTELLDNNTFPDNANARQYLVSTKGWIITDGGAA